MDNGVIKEYCAAIKNRTAQNDFIGALALAERLVYAFPDSEKGYYFRGLCYYGIERYDQAIANYNMAIKIKPLYAKAYFNLGTCYQQIKHFDSALINIGKAMILFSRQNNETAKNKCIEAIRYIENRKG